MKTILTALALSALAACAQAAVTSPITASITPGAANGAADISFGAGQSLQTTVIGPIGGATITPLGGGEPTGMASALKTPNEGVPIIGFTVTKETFTGGGLCPGAPTTAVVVMYPATGLQTLAAIAGGIPGNPGTRICALYTGRVNQLPSQFWGYN